MSRRLASATAIVVFGLGLAGCGSLETEGLPAGGGPPTPAAVTCPKLRLWSDRVNLLTSEEQHYPESLSPGDLLPANQIPTGVLACSYAARAQSGGGDQIVLTGKRSSSGSEIQALWMRVSAIDIHGSQYAMCPEPPSSGHLLMNISYDSGSFWISLDPLGCAGMSNGQSTMAVPELARALAQLAPST